MLNNKKPYKVKSKIINVSCDDKAKTQKHFLMNFVTFKQAFIRSLINKAELKLINKAELKPIIK